MLKSKSIIAPALDAIGAFTVSFGDFNAIVHDVPSLPLTGNAAASQATITLANTSGLAVGQTIVIQDTLSHESKTIITVTPATSIVVDSNLANAYAVTRGATVTVSTGVTLPVTGATASGQATILMASTAGFVVGQLVTIKDTAVPGNYETGTVITVNANVSLVLGVNLVNAYAGPSTVTANSVIPARVSVAMTVPAAIVTGAGALPLYTAKWAAAGNVVTVQVFKNTLADQANINTITYAASADMVGSLFNVIVDGE